MPSLKELGQYAFKCKCGNWLNSRNQIGSGCAPIVCPDCKLNFETIWAIPFDIFLREDDYFKKTGFKKVIYKKL